MKYVLLTGASGGLGLKLAKTLLDQGYFVILHYYSHKENVSKLHEAYLNQSLLIQADISSEEGIVNLKEILDARNIKIDILINNAAIDFVSELEEKTEETFLKVFKLNTLGPFSMIKYFGLEIEEKNGVILNISSDNAIDQYDVVTMEYDVSKAGLNIMTKSFAKHFKNSRVNAIAFGWLDTPMNDIPDNIKETMPFVPLEIAVDKIIDLIHSEKTGEIEIVR